MTTAHRPTWKAAVGKSQEGGWTAGGSASTLRSILDGPAHTKLKVRHPEQQYVGVEEQSRKEELLKVSLKKLQAMEEKRQMSTVVGKRNLDERVEADGRQKLLMATADVDDVGLRAKYDDADDECGGGGGGGWSDVEDAVDQDESDLDASDSDDDSGESDDEDSEDEEAALQAELAKIRKERESIQAKADAEADAEEKSELEEAALIGNPLLNAGGDTSGKLKRRWNDDVVFRNQAKGEPDQSKKRFINDTVRNDFHKRFLNKFIL
eukprot:CAMPEP_0198260842 /NCGR_PEP_ID=MMETSP1447-20131203/9706_1 /TAXON_ID=420782 /ORGANISM="Chaetoceros dichaeta, Strain CCMP1751" /LENGTH=265 /DNA_ID=CAMNT_0043948587 /DNA_START=33 /DNA_END=830 /DNA_ORIENTATION=-